MDILIDENSHETRNKMKNIDSIVLLLFAEKSVEWGNNTIFTLNQSNHHRTRVTKIKCRLIELKHESNEANIIVYATILYPINYICTREGTR